MTHIDGASSWLARTTGTGTIDVVAADGDGPGLRPGQVRIEVRAVGLNFRDLYFVRGNSFRQPVADRVPFSDCAGVVREVGADVTRFVVGDHVCSTALPAWLDGPLDAGKFAGAFGSRERDGVFRSSLVVGEHEVVRRPQSLSDEQAATLPIAGVTAWHALHAAGVVGPGSTVLIQTTGGVALFALQFALALGARVVLVSRSQDKLDRAAMFGDVVTIDSERSPQWDRDVLTLTDGVGVDLVLDMGLTGSLAKSVRAARFEGSVAVVGVVQEEVADFPIFPVMNKNLRVQGVETGSREMFEQLTGFVDEHHIEPVIDSVFAFDAYDSALDRLAEAPFGKVVLSARSQQSSTGEPT